MITLTLFVVVRRDKGLGDWGGLSVVGLYNSYSDADAAVEEAMAYDKLMHYDCVYQIEEQSVAIGFVTQ